MISPKTSRHALLLAVTGCLALTGAASASTTSSPKLVAAVRSAHAGSVLSLSFVNGNDAKRVRSFCVTLQRRTATGWSTVTRTHRVDIACPAAQVAYPQAVAAGARQSFTTPLYDDLDPGTYRVSVRYARPAGGLVQPPLTAGAAVATTTVTVLSFAPGPEPHLSTARLRQIALAGATANGDAHPTLIQSVENTDFADSLSFDDDLVYDWRWTYLIAIRGSFAGSVPVPAGVREPTSTVLFLYVTAATGQSAGYGFGDHFPALAKLGVVSTELG